MKIVKLSTMGGTGKLTARRAASASDGFDEKLAALKQRAKTDTQLVKKHLTQFIKRTFSLPDDVSVTTALLELGFEREIELHGEEDAQDLIERAFRRVLKECRGPAAMINASDNTITNPIPEPLVHSIAASEMPRLAPKLKQYLRRPDPTWSAHHPGPAIEAMIHVAKVVANAEARHSGKSYLVGSTPQPDPALYAFAANHPDARDAAFNIMFDCPPGGKLVRRRAPQRTAA